MQESIYRFEIGQKNRYPVCTKIAGHKIETACTIFDIAGKGLTSFVTGDMRNLIKATSKYAQDFYPETMGNTFIVNAPMSFRAIWTIIKGFMDEKTRTKI